MSLASTPGAPRWIERLVPDFLRAADERVRTETQSMSGNSVNFILVSALVMLAIFAFWRGFDAFEFVTGDALFSIHILEYGLLDFRPPPPNRLFPDVALHWLANPSIPDPYQQKLFVGLVIFVVTALSVGLLRGLVAFTVFAVVMVSNGFEFLVSATHYSLPLTVLLCLAARCTRLELPALFAFTFFNPLVLLPLAFVLVEPASMRAHLATIATVLAALFVNTLYSEFSSTIVQIVVLFPFWYLGAWLAVRLGISRVALLGASVLLPVAAATGLVEARYAVPVAASLVLVLFPQRSMSFDWRYVAFPAVAAAIFFSTVDKGRMDQVNTAYACLVDELQAREIDNVAVPHWTAKPLYFAAKNAAMPLTITQVDFARNISHPWMAPRSFYGQPTNYAVRDADTCSIIDGSDTNCGHATLAAVAETTPLCGMFDLYRYETAVPVQHAAPAGKIEAILQNLYHYVSVVTSKLK